MNRSPCCKPWLAARALSSSLAWRPCAQESPGPRSAELIEASCWIGGDRSECHARRSVDGLEALATVGLDPHDRDERLHTVAEGLVEGAGFDAGDRAVKEIRTPFATARMRLNSRSRRLTAVGLLTILVGPLLVTTCGGGSESGATAVDRRIAFWSDRDCDSEIYTMRPGGTGVRQLTANDGMASEPAWSPDGTRIAFTSDRDGYDTEIYTMRSDGTDVRQLTRNATGDVGPAWSPERFWVRSSRPPPLLALDSRHSLCVRPSWRRLNRSMPACRPNPTRKGRRRAPLAAVAAYRPGLRGPAQTGLTLGRLTGAVGPGHRDRSGGGGGGHGGSLVHPGKGVRRRLRA